MDGRRERALSRGPAAPSGMGSIRAEEAEPGLEVRARGGNPRRASAPWARDGAGRSPLALPFCLISGARGQNSGTQCHLEATFLALQRESKLRNRESWLQAWTG